MRTGHFAIDPAESGWTTIGYADLSTGFLGELIAQLTIQAPDGELYSQYWLRADVVDRRIEYLYYSEIEGAIVRGGTWPIEDIAEGVWQPDDDDEMLAAFTEMAAIADGPDIKELLRGMENDFLGAIDDQTLAELQPLWRRS